MKFLPSFLIAILVLLVAAVCIFTVVRLILTDIFAFIEKTRRKEKLKKIQREKEQEQIRREEELKIAKQRKEQELRRLQHEQELAKRRKWENSPLGKAQSAAREISGGVKGVADVAEQVGKGGISLLLGLALQKTFHSRGRGKIHVHSYRKKSGIFVKSHNRHRPR